jgi:glucosamine-6-phosphate deaminase
VVADPGDVAADLVADRLRANPALRLLLPAGHTPRGMYAALRARADVGAERATVFQLDEYLGLARGDPRSFAGTLDRELAGIAIGRRERLDGAAGDPDAEARRYQRLLDERPIDLAVLGIGRDAHVAFDEPGTPVDSGVHRVALDPSTIATNAADFDGAGVPREALTVGLRTLREAREIVLLATGEAKAGPLHAMLEGPRGPAVPASVLREHPALTVICDEAAASQLSTDTDQYSARMDTSSQAGSIAP